MRHAEPCRMLVPHAAMEDVARECLGRAKTVVALDSVTLAAATSMSSMSLIVDAIAVVEAAPSLEQRRR
jgi:hypothetical protein